MTSSKVSAVELDYYYYFSPVVKQDLPDRLQETLARYRRVATEWGVATEKPLVIRTRPGFTMKRHAPAGGQCSQDFEYLQNWEFDDVATRDQYVFFIPEVVPGSTGKSRLGQLEMLSEMRRDLELSDNHLILPEPSLAVGLSLSHYGRFNSELLKDRCVRTARLANGLWITVGPYGVADLIPGSGIHCGRWGDGGARSLGVFAIGVEAVELGE